MDLISILGVILIVVGVIWAIQGSILWGIILIVLGLFLGGGAIGRRRV